MNSNIIPSPREAVLRLTRTDQRHLQAIAVDATKSAARIRGRAYVTFVGLEHTSALTNLEGQLIQQTPLGAQRFEAIVNTFAGYICAEIAGVGL